MENAAGILDVPLDELRYVYEGVDPEEVTGMLLSRVPVGARVLEVGCGTGAILKLIKAERGATVVGVEPNATRAAAAAADGTTVHAGYFDAELARTLGSFDVIVFADVLEHMYDPGSALALASTLLNRGGCVLASVPNVAHWSVRLELLRGNFDYTPTGLMDSTHIRWFTKASLMRMFLATGFKDVSIDWTAGQFLPAYSRLPLVVKKTYGLRRRTVRWLVNRWPEFFGYQHVIVARV